MTHIAIYPGTFDPVTNGHIDIIVRAAHMTDRLIVSVAKDGGKTALFSLDERVEMVKEQIDVIRSKHHGITSVIDVIPFSGLLMHFAEDQKAKMIFRGLRAVTDFDYEFQMTGMNRRLNPNIETVFLMASETNQFISSRMVKEIVQLGGNISSFVPPQVKDALLEKIK
ncbi:MAG: pantetheine-phosphate adenylyltransferase [Alphaproteobacteria bacterium]|nr:pantetheine-phosphate adenylyltransferase [Alphaproteobacteria bacterium]